MGSIMGSDSAISQKSQVDSFPLLVTAHFQALISTEKLTNNLSDPLSDPIALQITAQNLEDSDPDFYNEDPLDEESHSPVPGMTHRYPDRVLLYLTHKCAVHCRFCTRRRKVADPDYPVAMDYLPEILDYLHNHTEIKEVILSGGDPLTLTDDKIDFLLKDLRKVNHLKSIRIHSRIPAVQPDRITERLCSVFKDNYPLTIVCHFNHPREITDKTRSAVKKMRMSGMHVLNQSVLLKGVNDSPEIMEELVLSLIAAGIQPYYLHQCDEVKGVSHFRTDPEKGIEIIKYLRGRNPGIAIPRFVIDLPGGGGKIPLEYDYRKSHDTYESSSGSIHRIKQPSH
jgi:lysine 2,3-aminomutase